MLLRDLRLAIRGLRATPIVSAVAILSLALGIGANTAIFSFVDTLLLRTLPVVEPQRLVTVSSQTAVNLGFMAGPGLSAAMWDRFRQHGDVFDGAFAWFLQRVNLAQSGEAEPANGIVASGDFFRTLGVTALLGRTFTTDDDQAAHPVAVISHRLWQQRFGGAADILDTPLIVDGVPRTIIGVTPPEFFGIEVGQSFDVALPLDTERRLRGPSAALNSPRSLLLTVMLRLKSSQALATATAALQTLQPAIVQATPNTPPFLKEPFTLVPAATGTSDRSRLRQQYEHPLFVIGVVVLLVLVIACVNVTNLLLARATARRYELSVRLALGASRARLAQQLLVESGVLAAAGGALGLLFAVWASQAVVAQISTTSDPVFLELSLDWRVLAFTTAVTVATVLIVGTVPALRATRVAPMEALTDATASRDGDASHRPTSRDPIRRGFSVSNGLVVAQVTLSLVLVYAAGLFGRTFDTLANMPLGFDGSRILLSTVDTARTGIDAQDRHELYHRLVDAAASAPGVAAAAGSMWTPAGGGGAGLLVDARGRATDPARQVVANFITPGWFATYGIPLRAGRDLTDHDVANGQAVVVVNEAFVRRFLPRQQVLGTVLDGSASRMAEKRTIVGVVGDAIYGSLRDVPPPTIYVPLAQSAALVPPGRTSVVISVRPTAGSAASVTPNVAAALTDVDRNLVFSSRPMADQIGTTLTQERLLALLSGFFGALALVLGALGLYGVTAYSVARRRTELGIRLALGATPRAIVDLVLSRVTIMVGTGLAVGVGASLWVSQFVGSLLYGVQATDATTLLAAASTLAVVGALAGWLPASRASRLDPAQVLRNQ